MSAVKASVAEQTASILGINRGFGPLMSSFVTSDFGRPCMAGLFGVEDIQLLPSSGQMKCSHRDVSLKSYSTIVCISTTDMP